MFVSSADHRHDPGGFECRVDDRGDMARVVVSGEIDISTAPALRRGLAQALAGGRSVLLDLGGVSFCDSTAVHAILDAGQRAREYGQRLIIIEGSPQVRRLFALVGLMELLDVFRDPADLVPLPSQERRQA